MKTQKILVKQLMLTLVAFLLPLCVSGQVAMEKCNYYKSSKTRTVEDWGEWTTLCTAVTDDSGREAMMTVFQTYGVGTIEPWAEPITIEQRTSKTDPTKHQLCLKGIFNAKNIILDYDSSTATISAERQSTGYAINKELAESAGAPDPLDEFEFYLKSATYRPANGYIDLQSAFVLVNDNLGFNRGLILRLQGVKCPEFTYAKDKPYVGRDETTITFNITFEEPIVKYRMAYFAPGEQINIDAVRALHFANPQTDLQYMETDQPTFEFTCTKIGEYNVFLIPIGADGNAVTDFWRTYVISYAEPEYESYVWNYIGESTVNEYAGSLLISSEDKWIQVDGMWMYKYPYKSTIEGVKTYRRADNPNIIGLRNLYGENHPYSSMYDYIDPEQDWWIYIDVTNPKDVKLLTTPVGVMLDAGYASFISQLLYAPLATYSDGVITFPYSSLVIDRYSANQSSDGTFDLEVVLPAEENSETAVEQLTLNPSDSGKQNVTIYDISGRRINSSAKLKSGVYIVNGQKVQIR